MRSKLFGRLMSFTLSATVALTSGIPALAYDGGGGDLPEEDVELLEEEVIEEDLEETGADFGAEETVLDEEVEEDVSFTEDENEEAEFEFLNDATFTIADASGTATRGLYTLAADNAAVISETGGNDTSVDFDSTRDFVFYAVPAMGYDWATGVSITVAGGYTEKGKDAYVATAGVDYTITDSDVSDAYTSAYSAHDWAKAKKITVKANSNVAKALAKAKALTAASTPLTTVFDANPSLKFTVPATVAQRVQLYVAYGEGLTAPTGIDFAANEYRPLYSDPNYTLNISSLISDADVNKTITAKVSLIGSDTIPYKTASTPSAKDEYKFASPTLTLDDTGVQYAYLMAKKGYKLTLTLDEGATPVVNKVNVKSANSDYVTFAQIDNKAPLSATKLPAKGIEHNAANRLVVYAYKTANTDATRKIIDITYTAEGTAGVNSATAKNIKVKNAAQTNYIVAGDTDYSDTTVYPTADWTEIDASVNTDAQGRAYLIGNSFTGNVVLNAVTAEQVTVTGYLDAVASTNMATLTVGNNSKTLATATTTLTAGITSSDSEAITGEDYTFTVAPTPGYKVNSVKVDMYGPTATGSVQCTEANGKLVVGNYGEYTIKAITGKLAITITAEKESTSLLDVSKIVKAGTSTNAADIILYRLSDKKQITTTPEGFVTSGSSLKFKAVPTQGKAIKSISYKIGSATEFTAITDAKADGTGAWDCEIKNITDNATIQIESEAGYTFVKAKNPYATVKINGVELKDEATIGGVPAGENGITITIEGKGGATVKDAWYQYAGSLPSQTSKPGSGYVDINKNGIYTLNPETLAAGTSPSSNEYYIYALTEREESAGNFTATFTGSGFSKPLTALTLYAGGNKTTARDAVHKTTLTTQFRTKDNILIATADQYELAKKGTAAIGDFSSYTLTTNDAAKNGALSDVITAKRKLPAESNWDLVTYTATLPLTVKPLKDIYDGGIELVPVVTSGGTSPIASMNGRGKSVIRVSDDAISDDAVAVKIQPYVINAKGEKVRRNNGTEASPTDLACSDINNNLDIKSVEWTTTPDAPATAVDPKLVATPDSGGCTFTISDVREEGTIKVDLTVNYYDGSKDTASTEITVVKETYGYLPVAFVTVNGKTTIEPDTFSIHLEKKAGGVNSAEVRYRVFESLKGTPWLTLANDIKKFDTVNKPGQVTEAAIDAYLLDGKGKTEIKEVTAEYATATGTYTDVDNKAVTVSNNGNKYTINAASQNSASTVIPQISVNGIPFPASTITVNVANTLETGKVTMVLGNSGTGYAKPQLKPTAAILGYAHSNTGSDTQGEITGFVFDGLTIGSTIKLPTIDDFDLTTVDPTKTLIGWTVTGPTYEKAGADWTVAAGGKTLTAIWEPKYTGIQVFNDDADAQITSSEDLGIGTTISLSVRYNAIDWEKTPDSSGNPVYGSTKVKAASGLTITKDNAESTALIIDAVNNTIKGNTSNPAAVVNYKWVDGETEYPTSPATTSFNVATANEYKLEMAAITVEEGQTKAFDAYYYLASETKDDAFNFNNSTHIKSYSAKIKTDDKEKAAATITTPSSNKIDVTGLKAGTTATLVVTVISTMNTKSEINVPVTVTASKKQIVLKQVGSLEVNTDDIEIPVQDGGNTATGEIITTNAVFNYVYDGSVQTASGTWTASLVPYTTDTTADDYVAPANQAVSAPGAASLSGTEVTIPIKTVENIFGTGKIRITYEETGTGDKYSKVFDVNTCYSLTFKAHTGNETNGSVFFVKNNGTTVKDGADIVEKIVYSGATNYTVSASKYTAVYVTDGTKNKAGNTNTTDTVDRQFLGWDDVNNGGWNKNATGPAEYEAGKDITFIVGSLNAVEWPFNNVANYNRTFEAWFGSLPISSIAGLPTVIRLTDENPGSGTAVSGSTTYTDYQVYEVSQNPVASTATIDVTADDKGLFTITTGAAAATLAVPDRTDTHFDDPGNGGNDNPLILWSTAQVTQNTTNGGPQTLKIYPVGTTSKVGSFAIAKLNGAVGKSIVHFVSGDLEYDIPVYLNGEYVSGTETRYMEDGQDLVEGIRKVNGREHFYKDKVKVVNGVIEIEVDGAKKLVLVEAGNRVSTPKNDVREFNNKTYFIQEDGYLFAAGTKKIGGVDRLFREDGSMVNYTDSDVVDGIITVNGTDYVIDPTTSAAEEDKLFTVANKKWTWSKSTDGKSYTKATVVFTSTDGRTKTIEVLATENDKTAAKYMEIVPGDEYTAYTAFASFTSKGTTITATDTKWLDPEGNEIAPHDHVWKQKGAIEWSVADSYNVRVATLTLICEVIADKPHEVVLTQSVAGITKGEFTSWTASFEEGKFTDTKVVKVQAGTTEEVELISVGDGIAIEGLDDEYAFTNTAIKPTFQVVDASLGTYLAKGVDYTVSYKYNKKVNYSKADSKFIGDAAQVIVKGKGNYSGQAVTQTFAIYDPKEDVSEDDALLTGAKLTLPKETLVYTGEAVYPSAIILKLKGGTEVTYNHTADGDYGDIPAVVTFANNVDKGTATVFLTGKPNDKGKSTTLKKTFKIAPVNMEANAKDFTVSVDDSAWAVKGAQPDVEVYWNGNKLIKGQDFAVKYANNKKVGTAATVTVSGKGNFTKKLAAKSFEITKFNLDAAEIVATTAAEGIVANKVKATVLDKDGNAIPAKMYTVTVSEGETVLGKQKLTAGQSITVKVEAKAGATDIEGSASESIEVKANFGKAKVKVAKGFQKIYTGEKITLDDDDMKNITVTIGSGKNAKTLVYDTDFEISDEGYSNNVKKGNMTVTLVGKGDYTGFKTFKVKIAPKPMQ